MYITLYTLYCVHHTMYIVLCTSHYVRRTMYITLCTLYYVHHTMYIVLSTSHYVHCAVHMASRSPSRTATPCSYKYGQAMEHCPGRWALPQCRDQAAWHEQGAAHPHGLAFWHYYGVFMAPLMEHLAFRNITGNLVGCRCRNIQKYRNI